MKKRKNKHHKNSTNAAIATAPHNTLSRLDHGTRLAYYSIMLLKVAWETLSDLF